MRREKNLKVRSSGRGPGGTEVESLNLVKLLGRAAVPEGQASRRRPPAGISQADGS